MDQKNPFIAAAEISNLGEAAESVSVLAGRRPQPEVPAATARTGTACRCLKTAQARIVKAGSGDGEITYKFAQAYDVLGDTESALRALDLSIDQGFFCYPYFAADPMLKAIRGEPQCAIILEKARRRQEIFKHRLEAK